MRDFSFYEKRREALRGTYLPPGDAAPEPVQTIGVDHLALICSDLERTIEFYTAVLGMRLTRIVQNRQVGQMTVLIVEIETVADHETIANIEANIVRCYRHRLPARFAKQHGHAQRRHA